MVVRPSGGFHGTIGGGALEWEALRRAREMLALGGARRTTFSHSLGPDLGQCCGGRVSGSIEIFDAERGAELNALTAAAEAPTQVLLFGAGHVGRALAMALAPLPFQTRWIDTREDAFPGALPGNATPILTSAPEAEIPGAPSGSLIVVATHSHALDYAVAAAALAEKRFAYVGLIGSATKRARFESRMRAHGLDAPDIASLVCPIGIPGLRGKLPAVIAASVAAQLLGVKVG